MMVCARERGLGASEIYTEKLSVSGTQVQTTAVFSPWQKGRVEQRVAAIKEVAGKTIFSQVTGGSAMSVVSYEVAHALNQKVGVPPATRVFGPVVPHPKVVEEGDELATRFIIRTSVREAFGRTCCFRSGQESSCYAFLANENVRALYPLFLLPTLPRQTSGYSNARTISGTLGFDWTTRSKWLVGEVWWKSTLVRD